MAMYWVTHPNLGISAKVDAPATDKARTVFLDWLERNGHIQRSDRQYWRRNMVAERMEYPEDVAADVELHYGYEESGPVEPTGEWGRESVEGRLQTDRYLQTGEPPEKRIGPGYEWERPEATTEVEEPYEKPISGFEGERPDLFEEEEPPQRPTRLDIGEVAKETPKKMSPIQKAALRGYIAG